MHWALSVALLVVVFTVATRPALAAPDLSLHGYVSARATATESRTSWLEGGFGRLATGDEKGDAEASAAGQLHAALDIEFARFKGRGSFGAYVHGVARAESEVVEGQEAGVVEAFVHASLPLRKSDTLRLQLGQFILPTSRENVEVAWSSPYTLTFSALNSWIGEEVRLTGLLSEYTLAFGAVDELRFGVSSFGGNDSTGALLAWRGWAFGDRLTTRGEIVPLPPLDSLAPGGPFEDQIDRGTKPLGRDLDSRLGWAGYLRYVRPGKATVQWSHYDNRGDRELHRGEYAWTTQFDLIAVDLTPTPSWSFVGEYLRGSTGMGQRDSAHVDLDMKAAYLLASFLSGSTRLTLRFDKFETRDVDLTGADNNNGDGHAWTLAFFWEPTPSLRLGLEVLDVRGERPEAALSEAALSEASGGFGASTDGRSVSLGVRYYFDW